MLTFEVGDILLFSGNGVFSNLIKAGTGSKFSHVGLVLPDNTIFESTSIGNVADMRTGEIENGVQLTNTDERIGYYDGEVYLRRMYHRDNTHYISRYEGVYDFIDKWHGTPYEKSNWELASSALDRLPWHRNKEDTSTVFCSELVTMALREWGYMENTGTPSNEFTPADYGADHIQLADGWSYGTEIRRLK